MSTSVLEPPAGGATPLTTGSCPANIRETKIGFGFKPQADLPTPNVATDLWSLTKVNPALATVTPVTEDDANDIGKGDEFPTQLFPVSKDTALSLEKYTSSEALAWAFCFATGKATKTAAGTGWTYAAVPSDPVVNCINVPPFTYVEQIRAEPDSIIDRALVGLVINDFVLTMESGPGRANCRLVINCVGTGKTIEPSGITIPTVTAEHFLNAASATITLGTPPIDYVALASFNSMEFRWNNNIRLDTGFYPGSGTQSGFAIRGRMEYNNREISLSFVARALKGSPEYFNLVGLTEGPVTITLSGATIGTGPSKHGMTINGPRAVFNSVVVGDAEGIVTVNCGVRFLKPTDGVTPIITMSATTTKDGILGL
jgi:hypothetical protein